MTTELRTLGEAAGDVSRPKAVLCGSFRRDPAGLQRDFIELTEVAEVLSPTTVQFAGEWDGFVYNENERHSSPREIEDQHLDAILRADFVWLHAPTGYVGRSAVFELGFARLAGTPVYTRERLEDTTLRQYVNAASSPKDAAVESNGAPIPAASLTALQRYYGTAARRRGYDTESVQDSMLLLTEEVGELARAIRQDIRLRRDGRPIASDAAMELADIQLYLLHLANIMQIDLAGAVAEKERVNDQRFQERLASAS